MAFKIRNIANVCVENESIIMYAVRMIVTHDNRLFLEVKDGSNNPEYQVASLKPTSLSPRKWEESNLVKSKNLHIGYTINDDLFLINENINTIKNKLYHRLSRAGDTIKLGGKNKIVIIFYNEKRIPLNDVLKDYIW